MKYRVLITNHFLDQRAGTELFVRDWALYLLRSGHGVTVYSPLLGKVAEELRSFSVPVVDDLFDIGEAPDIIHGHHHLETVAAMQRFPETPAVYWCHGWSPWQENPPIFSRIRKYVAVSGATTDRLVQCSGIERNCVSLVYNFVDTDRFRPRPSIQNQPLRALFLSNCVTEESGGAVARKACAAQGIELDIVGRDYGNSIDRPEEILANYDLVFARGRTALEAMAVGAAVIVCDTDGIGGYVSTDNFEKMQFNNFGLRTQQTQLTVDALVNELRKYNHPDSLEVAELVREGSSLAKRAPEILGIYSAVVSEWNELILNEARSVESAELARYLSRHSASCSVLQQAFIRDLRRHSQVELANRLLIADLNTANTEKRQIEERLEETRSELEPLLKEVHRLAPLEKEYSEVLNSSVFRYLVRPLWRLKSKISRMREKIHSKPVAACVPSRNVKPVTIPPLTLPFAADKPLLSCVIISVGNPPELVDAVKSIAEQREACEILVVNSGGGDPKERLKAAGLNPSVITFERLVSAAVARNIGIRNTKAPVVAFLASDCTAGHNWVAGRLAAHRNGLHAVASALLPSDAGSIIDWLSWTLLFSRRGPGLSSEEALRYGVSYSRELFGFFGVFREDLQTGEDSEFNTHISRFIPIGWNPDIVTYHKGPQRMWALMCDQIKRGARGSAAFRALHGGHVNALVARNALRRSWSCVKFAWKGAPKGSRPRLLLALPFIWPASILYSLGALWDLFSARSKNHVKELDNEKLYALICFHNEEKYLPDLLENIAQHVDGIVALDDGSTDGSNSILSSHPKLIELIQKPASATHLWNEPFNRTLLIEGALRRLGEAWVIVIDADERVEKSFRERALRLIKESESSGITAYKLRVRELWNGSTSYRVDGIWGCKTSARLFKLRTDFQFDDRAFHGFWAPLNSTVNNDFAESDLVLYHLRMLKAEDRETRRIKYEALDPKRESQAIGYEYLTDERDIQLESIPLGKEYGPLPRI